MAKAPTTFKDAYGVLQGHARTLRDQAEPNIDDLLQIVQESVTAYAVCRQRIDAVERALEETLKGAGVEAANEQQAADDPELGSAAGRRPSRPPGNTASGPLPDDDIPF
jgi:exodeoxyribonuclease VII small subunit